MKTGMHMTKDNLKKVLNSIKAMEQHQVLVGIPADDMKGAAPHPGRSQRDEPGPTNALIGYVQERGAPEINLPSRAFLVPGVRAAKPQIEKYLKQAAKYSLKGNKAGVKRAMHAAGLTAMSAVQHKLRTGPFAPLKPSTIAARGRRHKSRKARGPGDVTPLIDTAQLLRSITYVVR